MPNGVNNQFSRLNPTYRNRAQYNRVTNANPSGSTTMGSGIPQKATSIFRGPIPNVPTSAIQGILASPEYDPSPVAVEGGRRALRGWDSTRQRLALADTLYANDHLAQDQKG